MTRRAALPIVLVAGAVLAAPSAALAARTVPAAGGTWGKAANPVCKRYSKEIDKLPSPSNPSEAAASTQKVYEIAKRQTNELAKLPRAAGEDADVKALIGLWRQELGVVQQMVLAMKRSDTKAVNAIVAQGRKIDVKVQALGKKLGAADCVS